MTIEELLDALSSKGAGLLQTPIQVGELPDGQELWAILPDGRQYYLGVRRLVLMAIRHSSCNHRSLYSPVNR